MSYGPGRSRSVISLIFHTKISELRPGPPLMESDMSTCGKCGLEIHDSELGVRHFGHFTAHQEDRCIELLRQQLEQAQAWVAELESALNYIAENGQAIRNRLDGHKNIFVWDCNWPERFAGCLSNLLLQIKRSTQQGR